MRGADVVVVGSGLAGCAAALAAADHGLQTILLEKGPLLGGKTAWSNGGMWIPGNDFARAAGIDDSLEEARTYLRFLGGGYHVEEHLNAYIDGANAALRYFTGLGVRFQLVNKVSDIYYGIAPGTKPDGRMVEIALFSARELGAWREKVRAGAVPAAAFDVRRGRPVGRARQFRRLGSRACRRSAKLRMRAVSAPG